MTLERKTFTAVRWTTTATAVRTLLHLLQMAVLARLLAPEDYGLMAMVSVVLAFAAIFADAGMNSAYVQRQNVTECERSSLFWLNVGISIGLVLLILISSPLVARWFGDVRLTPLLMSAASVIVINSLGQQIRMNAEKELNFRPLVLLETGASLLGFASAVATAWAGWGVYALITGAVVGASGSTIFAWIFLADGWRPLWRCRLADIRGYLGFGVALVANNIVNEVNRNIDLLLGGHMLGATALGLYSLPRQMVLQIQGMVNPIMTRVGFPLISQVQFDILRVRNVYLKTLNVTASANAPLYVGLFFFAPEVVHIVLGQKWIDAVDLLRLLAIWGFLRSTGNPVGSLLLGLGRADLSLKWNLVMSLVVPPTLWLGSQYGTLGLAWALLALQIVMFVPSWYFLVRPLCGAKILEYTVVTLRPFLLALVSISPAYWIVSSLGDSFLKLTVGPFVGMVFYLAISCKINKEMIHLMVGLLKR